MYDRSPAEVASSSLVPARPRPTVLWASAPLVAALFASCAPPVGRGTQPVTLPVPGPGEPLPPLPDPPDHAAGDGGITCGSARCKVGSETCCGYSDVFACVPRAREGSAAAGENQRETWGQAQYMACTTHPPTDLSLTSMATCDDANDCRADEACCAMGLGGDMIVDVCERRQGSASSCDFGERCHEGSPCRTAGTQCIEGRCRKGPMKSCGGVACSDDAPLCCAPFGDDGKPTCGTTASCEAKDLSARFECRLPSDCPPGEACMSFLGGTTCQGSVDVWNGMLLCAADADCPATMCEMMAPGARPRCQPLDDATRTWLKAKACQCPAGR